MAEKTDIKTTDIPEEVNKYEQERISQDRDNRPDFFSLTMSMTPEDIEDTDNVATMATAARESNRGFSLRDKYDYWKLKAVKERFDNDIEKFEDHYNKTLEAYNTANLVNTDIMQLAGIDLPQMQQGEEPGDLTKRAIGELSMTSFEDSYYAKGNGDAALGIFGQRHRIRTVKKLAQQVGVKTEDGDWESAPGMWEQIKTSDMWRVARDEEGNPKMTLTGSHYLERVDGSEDVRSTDQMVNIFSSGAAEDTFLDGNRVTQSTAAVIGRQIHKFTPWTRVVPFVASAVSGLAELVKSTGDYIDGDRDNGTHRAMNSIQNYIAKFNMDMDENSKTSMWNANNMVNSIGEIGPQILGMAAVAKAPAYIMGLKSASKAGNKGLEVFTKALKAFEDTATGSQKLMAQQVGSWIARGSMSLMSTEDFAKTAKENKLSPKDAFWTHVAFLGFMHNGPSKYSEKIYSPIEERYGRMVNKRVFKAYAKNMRQEAGNIAKATTEAAKNSKRVGLGKKMAGTYNKMMDKVSEIYKKSGHDGVMAYLGAGANEFTEEVLELTGETGIKWMYNNSWANEKDAGDGRFQDIDWDQFAQEALFSGVMGFVGGGIGKAAMSSDPSTQRKAAKVTDENIITHLANTALDKKERDELDRHFKSVKAGMFGSTDLSFVVDPKTGKYMPVDESSADPARRVSQDDVIKSGFTSVWEGVKSTVDKKRRDIVEQGKEWNDNIQEAFGDELSTLYSESQLDMSKQIGLIVKYESEIGSIEEQLSDKNKDLTATDKKNLQERKKEFEDNIKEAEAKIEEIVSGRSANEYFEKAIFEIDPTINVNKKGEKLKKGDFGYINYEDFKKERQRILKDSKRMVEKSKEDEANLNEVKKRIRAISNMEELDELLGMDFIYDSEIQELLKAKYEELYKNDADKVEQVKKSIQDFLAENADTKLKEKADKETDLNKLLEIVIDQEEDYRVKDLIKDENESLSKSLSKKDLDVVLGKKKRYSPTFMPENTETESLKQDILKETDPDKLYDLIMAEDGRIISDKDFKKIRQHIEDHMEDSKDYKPKDKDKGTDQVGLSKQQRLDRMSAALKHGSLHSIQHQSIMKALDMDVDSGGKSLTSQITEELDAMMSSPEAYNSDLANLERIRRELNKRRELVKALVTVDDMTAKFQAVNGDKFKFEREIENLLPDEAKTLLKEMTNTKLSTTEQNEKRQAFNKAMEPFLNSLEDYMINTELRIKEVSVLIQFAKANQESSIEGMQKSDMKIMNSDIGLMYDILDKYFDVNDPAFKDLHEGNNDFPGIREMLDIAENDTDYGKKRATVKAAEMRLHEAFNKLEPSRQQQIVKEGGNLYTPETAEETPEGRVYKGDIVVFNYFSTIVSPSFKHIHHRFKEAVKDMKSTPTYEQEAASIQMAVMFLDDNNDRFGMRRKSIAQNHDTDTLDNIGFVRGVGGSGKTTYVAAVVANMMGSDTKVLMATPHKEQRVTLDKALRDQNIDTVSTATNDNGNYDISMLIADIQNSTDAVNDADLIIVDEVTFFSEENMRNLQRALNDYNKIRKENNQKPLQVLALGDIIQASKTKKAESGGVKQDNIRSFTKMNRTREISTSMRVGFTTNMNLLETIRKKMGKREDALEDRELVLNYQTTDKDGDIGVEIYDGKDPMERIRRKVSDARERKQSIAYVHFQADPDRVMEMRAMDGVEVLRIDEVQGREFKQVIVDVNGLDIDKNYDNEMAKLQHLYTALSRAKNGVLMMDNNGRPWTSVEGLVPEIESKLNKDTFSELKSARMNVLNNLIKMEEERFGKFDGEEEFGKKEDTTDDKDIAVESLSSYTSTLSAETVENAFMTYLESLKEQINPDLNPTYAKTFKSITDPEMIALMDAVESSEDKKATFLDVFQKSTALSKYFDKESLADDLGIDLNKPVSLIPDVKTIIEALSADETVDDKLKNDLLEQLDKYEAIFNEFEEKPYVRYQSLFEVANILFRMEHLMRNNKDLRNNMSEFVQAVYAKLYNNGVDVKYSRFTGNAFDPKTMQLEDGAVVSDPSDYEVTSVLTPLITDGKGDTKQKAIVTVKKIAQDKTFKGTPEMMNLFKLATPEEQAQLSQAYTDGKSEKELKRMLADLAKTNKDIEQAIDLMRYEKVLQDKDTTMEAGLRAAIALTDYSKRNDLTDEELANAYGIAIRGDKTENEVLDKALELYFKAKGIETLPALAAIALDNTKPAHKEKVSEILAKIFNPGEDFDVIEGLYKIHQLPKSTRKQLEAFKAAYIREFKRNGFNIYFNVVNAGDEFDYTRHQAVNAEQGHTKPDKITEVLSPLVTHTMEDGTEEVLHPAKVKIHTEEKKTVTPKKQTQGSTEITGSGVMKKMMTSRDDSKSETNLLGKEAMRDNLLTFTWLTVDLDKQPGEEGLSKDEINELKQEVLNAGPDASSRISLRLKIGDISGNLANQSKPYIENKNELDYVNGGKDLMYIEATIKKPNKTYRIVLSVLPHQKSFERSASMADNDETAVKQMHQKMMKLREVVKQMPNGMNVTQELLDRSNRQVTKGRLFNGKAISLQEAVDNMSEGNQSGVPTTEFSSHVYTFKDNITDGNGNVLLYAGTPVVFASQDSRNDYEALYDFLDDVDGGRAKSIPDNIIMLRVDNRGMDLFDMISLYEGKGGRDRLSEKDAQILIGRDQGERLKHALEFASKYLSNDKEAMAILNTLLGKQVSESEKNFAGTMTNPYHGNKPSPVFDDSGDTLKTYSGVMLNYMATLTHDPVTNNALGRIWEVVKDIDLKSGKRGMVKSNGKNTSTGFHYGIMTNILRDHKRTYNPNATGAELEIMRGVQPSSKRLKLFRDTLVTKVQTIAAPAMIIQKSAIDRFMERATTITESTKDDALEQQEKVVSELFGSLVDLRESNIFGDTASQEEMGYLDRIQSLQNLRKRKDEIMGESERKQFIDAIDQQINDDKESINEIKQREKKIEVKKMETDLTQMVEDLKSKLGEDLHADVDSYFNEGDFDAGNRLMDHILTSGNAELLQIVTDIDKFKKQNNNC